MLRSPLRSPLERLPPLPAPTNTAVPTITGTAQVGQTLTASTGTWTGALPMTFAYQWLADDVVIPGADESTYEPVVDDVDAVLKVRVTATNVGGSTSATSAGTDPVIAAA
jgi:hypothetical protein